MKVDLSAAQRAHGTPLMSFTQAIGRGLLWALSRAEIVGMENLPSEGNALIAANHTHVVDGPLMYGVVRRPAVFFVKSEAFIGPISPFLRRIGQIPIRRGVPERAPIAAALETLAEGGVVGVFPEGTRGSGDVAEVRHGIAYLAVRSGAPVIPVACVGTKALLARRTIRRPRVRIVIGEPVKVPTGAASRSRVSEAAEQIRAEMAALVTSAGAEQ